MVHNNNSAASKKRKRRNYLPFTADELDLLFKKRYIDEEDLLRFLKISESTMYNLIRTRELVPSWLGSKKMFDIEELYLHLERSKLKGRLK